MVSVEKLQINNTPFLGNLCSNRCALVTGATGYIGSHLVGGLLAEGWQVHAITRPSSSHRLLDAHLHQIILHNHDGSMSGMLKIMATVKPTIVFHLASLVLADHQAEDIDQLITTNILFPTQLIEAMLQSGVKNFVNTETFWQHRKDSIDYDPVCLYAATKQAFRDILIYYVKGGHVNAISLVLFDNYGPNDPRKKLFSFLKQASQDARQIDMTPGEQIVDMTQVDDVVAAYLRAGEILLSENMTNLDTYVVTSGQRMSLKKLIELIVCETGICINPNWGGRPYRTNEVMEPFIGKPLPGWQPKIDLAVGVREVFKRLD